MITNKHIYSININSEIRYSGYFIGQLFKLYGKSNPYCRRNKYAIHQDSLIGHELKLVRIILG